MALEREFDWSNLLDSPRLQARKLKLQPSPSPPPDTRGWRPQVSDAVLIASLDGGKRPYIADEVISQSTIESENDDVDEDRDYSPELLLPTDDLKATIDGAPVETCDIKLTYLSSTAMTALHMVQAQAVPNGPQSSHPLQAQPGIAQSNHTKQNVQSLLHIEASLEWEDFSTTAAPCGPAEHSSTLPGSHVALHEQITPSKKNSLPHSTPRQSGLAGSDVEKTMLTTNTNLPSPSSTAGRDVMDVGKILKSTAPWPSLTKKTKTPTGLFLCTFSGCAAPPFPTAYLLESHAKVHSEERSYFCQVPGCNRAEGGKGFKRENELKRHRSVHNPHHYKCPFCPIKEGLFPRSDNLQRHIRAIHPDQDEHDPLVRAAIQPEPMRTRRRRTDRSPK